MIDSQNKLTLLRWLFMSCLLPFLCSCVKEVTMDAREDPQIVVECILCDEPVQTLYLTYTKGASREAAPSLDEADAVLADLTEGREVGRFTRAEDGSWQLSQRAWMNIYFWLRMKSCLKWELRISMYWLR